jgi:hypothetical protein
MLKVPLSLPLAAMVWIAAAPAFAQPTTAQKATAEAYFDDGLRLMRSGNFAEACPKLEASQRIDPAVGTLLYLGECFEKQGRTASAWVTFREADALARSANQPQRADMARVHADRLQARLSRLTVELTPEALRTPGLQVRCGAVSLDASMASVTVPVDPGEVVVEASAPGYAKLTRAVTLAAGARLSVSIPALARDSAAVSAPPVAPPVAAAAPAASRESATRSGSPPPPTAPLPAKPTRSLAWPIALGAVGVVGLGVGSVFGIKAIKDASNSGDLCPNARCTEKRGETLMADARREANVSNVGFAVGAAGVAAAIVVYVLDKPAPNADSARLVPSFGTTHAGIAFEGRL